MAYSSKSLAKFESWFVYISLTNPLLTDEEIKKEAMSKLINKTPLPEKSEWDALGKELADKYHKSL